MILKWFNNLLVKSFLVSSDATKREIIKKYACVQTTSSLMLSGHSKLEMFLIMIQFCFVVAVFQLLSHVQLFGTS